MMHRLRQWWRSLAPRERVLTGAGLAVLLGSLVFAAIADPLLERLARADRQLARHHRMLRELADLATDYQREHARLTAIEAQLPTEGFSLLSHLEEASKASQVRERITTMQPQSLPAAEGYQELAVELRLDGVAWPQLLSFLVAVEHAPPRVQVTRLHVRPRFETPHLLEATLLVSSHETQR